MFHFSINDLENLSGIKAHTIRIWEQRYSFLKPARSNTNIRYYSNDELKALLNISLLNKYGFRVSQIDQMSTEEIEQRIDKLSIPQAGIEYLIQRLILAMVNLDMHLFEALLNKYENVNGINAAITDIIHPFLQRTAFLNNKSGASNKFESIVSGTLRLKLTVAIEQLNAEEKHQIIIIFLPEGCFSEIELLYAQFLLKQKFNVIYLGANVPLKDVLHIASYKNPDFVYTHIINNMPSFNPDKFLLNLSKLSEQTTIIISGNKWKSYKKIIPSNIRVVDSIYTAMEII